MTELSLAPMAAKEAGISFDELIDRICRSALKK
jgi:D-alanine-D-alanine ligase-like ATP-grasp enzyme